MKIWIEFFANLVMRLQARSRRSTYKLNPTSSAFAWRIKMMDNNHLTIDAGSTVRAHIIYERPTAVCSVGKRTFIGDGTISIAERVDIGDDVLVSWGVSITDHNSHSIRFSLRANDVLQWRMKKKNWDNVEVKPIRIGDKAWIGFNAIILKGVSIGEGAVVGAGSVVTKDIEPWTIVAGSPARFVREIPPNER